MGRGVMEMNPGMPGQPPVMLGLVSVQVVEDHVNLPLRVVGDHLVHEIEKLSTPPSLVMPGLDLTGCDIEGGKEGRCPVALVAMVETGEGLPVRKPEPALSALESLDVRFFVNTDHNRILRRIQIEPDDVC